MSLLEQQLRVLTHFLSSQKIKYVILGGVAVSIYGEPRLTADIDVNIILDKSRLGDFLSIAGKYGFYLLSPDGEEIAKESGVIPLCLKKKKIGGKFDLIIAENALEYAAIQRGKTKRIGSVKARFVSPEDLIIHKISSSRPRDIEDLQGLLIRQKNRLDVKYIRAWLEKIDKVNKGVHLCSLFNRLLKQ